MTAAAKTWKIRLLPWFAVIVDDLSCGHQAADRGEQAGDAEDADAHPVDLDPGRPRRLEVAAERVDGTARSGGSGGRDPTTRKTASVTQPDTGNPEPVRVAEPCERPRHVVERLVACEPLLQAGEHDQHREREDEGAEAELDDLSRR